MMTREESKALRNEELLGKEQMAELGGQEIDKQLELPKRDLHESAELRQQRISVIAEAKKEELEERYPEMYVQECQALEAYLTELWKPEPGWEVHVWAFADSTGGVRISEISVMSRHAGFSYMRGNGDQWVYALILACEDFVLTFHVEPFRPEGWDSDVDEHGEAKCVIASFVQEMNPSEQATATYISDDQ